MLVTLTFTDDDLENIDVEMPAAPRLGEEFILPNKQNDGDTTFTVIAVWWTLLDGEGMLSCELDEAEA